MTQVETRLTALAHGGGCGCKLSPAVLRELLAGMPAMQAFPGLLVGVETGDDAAVYRINDEQAVVATTDFFMPIVDDPFDFGRIAAANALSDVYAMGGRPLLALAILGVVLAASNVMAQTIGDLFQMMGGMDAVKKLSGEFLQSAAKDPRLSELLGKADTAALAPKLSDQMCSLLGGGCKAPLTDQQIAAGESKLDANQTKALSDTFSSSLGSVTSNPLAKQGVSKAIAPKLGGIVGALL